MTCSTWCSGTSAWGSDGDTRVSRLRTRSAGRVSVVDASGGGGARTRRRRAEPAGRLGGGEGGGRARGPGCVGARAPGGTAFLAGGTRGGGVARRTPDGPVDRVLDWTRLTGGGVDE